MRLNSVILNPQVNTYRRAVKEGYAEDHPLYEDLQKVVNHITSTVLMIPLELSSSSVRNNMITCNDFLTPPAYRHHVVFTLNLIIECPIC